MAIMHDDGSITGRLGEYTFYVRNGRQMVRRRRIGSDAPRLKIRPQWEVNGNPMGTQWEPNATSEIKNVEKTEETDDGNA